jgi:hypothetical protein
MRTASVAIIVIAWACVGQVGAAPERKTVYSVAKVDGRTKKIGGEVYHLVAIRLDPRIWLLGSGLTNPVLLVQGSLGKAALADEDEERELADTTRRYELFWLRLPDKGEVEVIWGALADPKEKDAELRDRLIKAGYAPFKVDAQKLPVVKPGDAKELLAELSKLAEPPKRK